MKKLCLLLLLLLTACAPSPKPREPAVPAVAQTRLQPSYVPVSPGQVLDVGFARLTVGAPAVRDSLRQGYAAILPPDGGKTFRVLELNVENRLSVPLPTEHFLVRVTWPGRRSFGGSAHCFGGKSLAPGQTARILLFAAVPKGLPPQPEVRFLFHENFAPPDGSPMAYRYVLQEERASS